MNDAAGVHLVVGGYPPGEPAGHDMDFARLRLLELLAEQDGVRSTVSSDFADLGRWLGRSRLLVSYVAGPFPDEAQNRELRAWLEGGGRWLALHGTSGGKAARVTEEGRTRRMMVKLAHHDTLGCFFLNHPPLRRFRVAVAPGHVLGEGLPESFEVCDELYLIELLAPQATDILLTTELPVDPSPPRFGFAYERDTALQADGRTRVIAYTRDIGRGAVAYVALGHCHSRTSNTQPLVDASVAADGRTPLTFRGPWDDPPYRRLLSNALRWGTGATPRAVTPPALPHQ
ncbi:MAG: ThuA domain-containing protein [Acidimicrobiia bacterium]|nr:ThuA domain-containing protein [Acidimicrobiia bacterium]